MVNNAVRVPADATGMCTVIRASDLATGLRAIPQATNLDALPGGLEAPHAHPFRRTGSPAAGRWRRVSLTSEAVVLDGLDLAAAVHAKEMPYHDHMSTTEPAR